MGGQVEIRNADGDFYAIMPVEEGRYRVINLPPQNYVVQEIDPPGYRSTTPNKIQAQVRANTCLEINFGDVSNTIGLPHRVYFPVLQQRSRGAGEQGSKGAPPLPGGSPSHNRWPLDL